MTYVTQDFVFVNFYANSAIINAIKKNYKK